MIKLLPLLLASTVLMGSAAIAHPEAAHKMGPDASTRETAAADETATTDKVQTETGRLNQWFDEKFTEELDFSPVRQTSIGMRANYDKIDDYSADGAAKKLAWRRASVAEMQASFDYAKLTDDGRISWDMWLFRLKQEEMAAQFSQQDYALHQFNGEQSFFPTFLINQHVVETEADMTAYIARLGQSARALDQLLVKAQNNAAAGTRPPRFAYEGVIQQSANITTGAPFDDGPPSAIWQATLDKISGLRTQNIITAKRADMLETEAKAVILNTLQPAYQRIITWFNSDMANSDAVPRGVSALPNGEAYYTYRLAAQTTTDLTADDIHNIGLSEVARLRTEMETIKNIVGFEGDLQAFFQFVRNDDQFYFSSDDKGAQDYIDAAEGHLAFIKTRLPEFFGLLPKADLVVKRVEPFREQDGAAQHYRPGTLDGSRPGTYYAHLSDMRAMSIPSLEVIAYHEGLPGHHMQFSIAQELEAIPKFRAQGEYIAAFGEGWGLYSEILAKDMGAYADPYSDFGRLTTEMWRSIRLVVDTGLHAKGWSEDEAVEYFLANSPIPEAAVRSEVRRYLVMPGQATSYKIGMLKILELRAKAQAALGDKFDIRGFHDTVLGGGSVPLSILETQVDQWIAKVSAN